MWDPAQYQRYSDERSRPFFELLARRRTPRRRATWSISAAVLAISPRRCAERWPDARGGRAWTTRRRCSRRRGRRWPACWPAATGAQWVPGRSPSTMATSGSSRPRAPLDVIVCNAVLQWIPGHRELLPRWAGMLSAGGWLAFQVPGNFDQPSHQILRELAGSARWRAQLAGVAVTRQTHHPGDYLDLLACAGYEVDAWESTYLHVLHGDDPVLDWYKGSGLRPVIAALAPGQAAEFLERVRAPVACRVSGPRLWHRAAVPAGIRRRAQERRSRVMDHRDARLSPLRACAPPTVRTRRGSSATLGMAGRTGTTGTRLAARPRASFLLALATLVALGGKARPARPGRTTRSRRGSPGARRPRPAWACARRATIAR